MTALAIEGLHKSYVGQPVLSDFRLVVETGAFTFLLGPSGCGKSTLLRIIAGIEAPDAGTVELFGERVNDPRPIVPCQRRGVGMVFQHDALWPHMTVEQHIRFVRKGRAGASHDVTAELLARVRLRGLEKRYPASLSGGERQRLALARALAHEPTIMLLDEPTRHLDRPLAEALREEFAAVLRDRGVTVIYVTHDQAEAFELADRVVLLDETASVLADGSPEELYRTPPSCAAANLLGHATSVRGVIDAEGQAPTPLGEFACELAPGARFVAFFRPEDISFDGDDRRALVTGSRFHGGYRELSLDVDGEGLRAQVPIDGAPSVGDRVPLAARRAPHIFEEPS